MKLIPNFFKTHSASTRTVKQRTIGKAVTATGIGLHSGEKVSIHLFPAPENSGITYVRTDLNPNAIIKMKPDKVIDTVLCTNIVNDEGVKISTVEHLTSALSAFGIDNLLIEIDAPEIPIMDGSSHSFMFLLEEAGFIEQNSPKKFIRIKDIVRVEDGDKWAEFRPFSGFRFSFKIDFDHPFIQSTNQKLIFDLSKKNYLNEISRARTFGFMKDIEKMRYMGLGLGGSLDSAVVLDEFNVINPEGLRYPDEFVRHKILDSVGDLYMSGHTIIGEMVAYKSGHKLNNMLLNKMLQTQSAYEEIILGETIKGKNTYSESPIENIILT